MTDLTRFQVGHIWAETSKSRYGYKRWLKMKKGWKFIGYTKYLTQPLPRKIIIRWHKFDIYDV